MKFAILSMVGLASGARVNHAKFGNNAPAGDITVVPQDGHICYMKDGGSFLETDAESEEEEDWSISIGGHPGGGGGGGWHNGGGGGWNNGPQHHHHHHNHHHGMGWHHRHMGMGMGWHHHMGMGMGWHMGW